MRPIIKMLNCPKCMKSAESVIHVRYNPGNLKAVPEDIYVCTECGFCRSFIDKTLNSDEISDFMESLGGSLPSQS